MGRNIKRVIGVLPKSREDAIDAQFKILVGIHDQIARHEAARKLLRFAVDLVVSDVGILSGTPVIRGTRVPVFDVLASVNKGFDEERIRAAYPSLEDTDWMLLKIYAAALHGP